MILLYAIVFAAGFSLSLYTYILVRMWKRRESHKIWWAVGFVGAFATHLWFGGHYLVAVFHHPYLALIPDASRPVLPFLLMGPALLCMGILFATEEDIQERVEERQSLVDAVQGVDCDTS